LPVDEMAQEFGQHFEAVNDLAREHLWLLEADGYRFQFDLVREFLQSQHLRLFTVLWSLAPNIRLLWRQGWRSPLDIGDFSPPAWRDGPHSVHRMGAVYSRTRGLPDICHWPRCPDNRAADLGIGWS
jgi:hypothetical protein